MKRTLARIAAGLCIALAVFFKVSGKKEITM